MPDRPLISLTFPHGLRTGGEVLSGVLNLNLILAEEKDVVSVKISLRGEINAQVTVRYTTQTAGANGTSNTSSRTRTYRESLRLFTQTQVIWTPDSPVPSRSESSGVTSLPFSFMMPSSGLPPSFHGGDSRTGGSVQYYLHAVAVRKSWYRRNTRIDQVFPFLPNDLSPAPSLPLPNWPGEWQVFRESKKIRRGIISRYGLAEVEFHMPSLPAIPLFRPLPVKLRVKSTSKLLPLSAARDPSKFRFPRNPKPAKVDLTLRQVCTVVVHGYHKQCTDDLGLQAGFGLPRIKGQRATWGNEIETSITPPRWAVDQTHSSKGRWFEEVTFSSTLIFRCPPPFTSQSLASFLFLDLDVHFPGVFPGITNAVNIEIGPLPLTSGIAPPQNSYGQLIDGDPLVRAQQLMPQPQIRELDLPPPYYEVVHMDEGTQGAHED